MDVFETNGEQPDGLAAQSYDHARCDQDSIHSRAVEHDMGAKYESPGGEYQREKRVAVAEKEIPDGDVPGMQSSTVL
jgi:hypothetical protein